MSKIEETTLAQLVIDVPNPNDGEGKGTWFAHQIKVYVGAWGSVRFILFNGASPVAGMKMMLNKGKRLAVYSQAYTTPNFRRMGCATSLIVAGRRYAQDQGVIGKKEWPLASEFLSEDGAALVRALNLSIYRSDAHILHGR